MGICVWRSSAVAVAAGLAILTGGWCWLRRHAVRGPGPSGVGSSTAWPVPRMAMTACGAEGSSVQGTSTELLRHGARPGRQAQCLKPIVLLGSTGRCTDGARPTFSATTERLREWLPVARGSPRATRPRPGNPSRAPRCRLGRIWGCCCPRPPRGPRGPRRGWPPIRATGEDSPWPTGTMWSSPQDARGSASAVGMPRGTTAEPGRRPSGTAWGGLREAFPPLLGLIF